MAMRFPSLATGLLHVSGLSKVTEEPDAVARYEQEALRRLEAGSEADLAPIRAWRSAFSSMGLKPTKYRCASEALLRRLRKENTLPRLHPIVDLCNAVSAAYAIPVAAFDLERIEGDLTVGPAKGNEEYLTFGGELEHPTPGEIIFADTALRAHARRWTNRQSAHSAISKQTDNALLVMEALHADAEKDVAGARDALASTLGAQGATVRKGLLIGGIGRFETTEVSY
ncbi:MAG: phenylalanine--tRNA ligase beta subunit-related protein [Paracoccaceae bacterium]|nr:phenylalanine--tRNA ligase beta subunit-related protein [Paracoccaceae bacterium]